MNSTFIRDMRKVLLEQNLTLAQYIQKVSNVQATQLPEDYSPEKMEQLVIAVVKNLEKQVGLQITIEYLQTYLYSSQEFRLMLPEQLKRQISTIGFKSHLLGLLMEQNTDVKGYIQNLMQAGKLDFNKKLYLDNAILETYQKFETLYRNGSQPIPGRNFVQSSMQQFLRTGEYTGFTKNNNARQNLIDNVSWQDVVNLTRDALSLPQNKPLTDQEISLISYQYTEGVIQNYYDQLKQRA